MKNIRNQEGYTVAIGLKAPFRGNAEFTGKFIDQVVSQYFG